MSEAIKIFYSYSRQDLDMRNTLEDHLSALRAANKISTWHDLQLEAGTEWEQAILHKLDTADIILLLVSRSFMASEYCYGTELKRAIARHTEGTARVIPIILRSCDWNHADVPFSKLNVLPTHAKAITSWPNQEEAFTIVAQRIRETVDQLRAEKLADRQAKELEKQERIQREQRQADEQERLRQAEQLRQQQAEAVEEARLKQRELERQQQEQLKQATVRSQQITPPQSQSSEATKGNYTQLETLLKAGKWEEADQETAQQMCQVMGRQTQGWLRSEDIEQFPCADLRAIDQLWVKYSNGKFGFSVQKKIWQQHGSPTEYNNQWEKFGETVGWKDPKGWIGSFSWYIYENYKFDLVVARSGHLPSPLLVTLKGATFGGVLGGGLWERFGVRDCVRLLLRAQTCNFSI